MIPQAVHQWLREAGYGSVIRTHSVTGGCINNGIRLETTGGETFFLKTNSNLPPDVFQMEAFSLNALMVGDGPHIPKPLVVGPDFILEEDLAPAPMRPDFWNEFGRQLAALHRHTQSRFGFDHDNYLGSTPQPNPWTENGYVFFVQHRLLYQASLAEARGYLKNEELHLVERLCQRLPELVPDQPASLIHGDLWGGNVISDHQGHPAIIDPATHFGWAEAELGMTTLFGGFPESFYRAYEQAHPLEPGWRSRLAIYNLYHLLNHLNLFGMGYYGDALSILRRYGS